MNSTTASSQAPGQGEAGPSTQPAPKKRRISTKGKTGRRTFYAAPSKMSERPPKYSKNPKTLPHIGMVRKSWRKTKDTNNLVLLVENVPWWDEFESRIRIGDISDNDQAYLDEMDEDSSAGEEA
jgi:hypothetical protein